MSSTLLALLGTCERDVELGVVGRAGQAQCALLGGGLGRSVLLLLGFPPFALKTPITFVAPVLFTVTSLVWRVLSNLR